MLKNGISLKAVKLEDKNQHTIITNTNTSNGMKIKSLFEKIKRTGFKRRSPRVNGPQNRLRALKN